MRVTTSSGPLAEFLRDRRESLTPEQVGLSDSSRRRVRGLRRAEVAELAGISADYYLRIEQGRGHRPSAEVLSALSRALLLDAYGDEHLQRMANLSAGHEAPAVSDDVPAGIRALLDLHPETPAYLSNGTLDVIGVNEPGRLLAPGGLRPGLNLVLSVFEHYPDPHSESHWRRTASNLVASLRYHADPRSPRLRHIVDTLSATDPRFVELWQQCEVRPHTSSWPLVYIESHGWVGLRSETLAIPASRGCTMTQFFAEPNTPGVAALRDLVRRANERADA
jgi:transcriptional regulator with XRE-family HTH domain